MKPFVKFIALGCCTLGIFCEAAFAARTARAVTCKSTVSVAGYIYKNSAPIRASSAHSSPIIGFRTEPTLIGLSRKLSRASTSIIDSKGNVLARCPWASAHGSLGGRYRCTVGTASVRRAAIRNTRSPAVRFTNGSVCVSIPDAGKCYGSVKGLCNRTIG